MNPFMLIPTLRTYVAANPHITGRRILSFITLLVFGICVWFYGYMIGYGSFRPLVSIFGRIMIISIAILCWTVFILTSLIYARKQHQVFSSDQQNNVDTKRAAETGEIRSRFDVARALLRQVTRKRFNSIYQLPWYVILGAPGSGKTTALTSFGLQFPFGDAPNHETTSGNGRTRGFDWWLTEDAVLIDTAGHHTIQNDPEAITKFGWECFLSLLKKHRPSQPLNGVFVTLSIGDLFNQKSKERREDAHAIQQRLREMQTFLGAKIPVYILLTKADLLDGFIEFFDDFELSARDQIWGVTFPSETSQQDAAYMPELFSEEFTLLESRLNAILLQKLQQEPDKLKRGRIFRFPSNLVTLKQLTREALVELCSGSKLGEAAFIRGIYLTSGAQPCAEDNQSKHENRRYFFTRLFHDVVCGESALITRDKYLSKRQFVIRHCTTAITGLILIIVFTGWVYTFVQSRHAITNAQIRINAYEHLARDIPHRNVNDTDFLRILPALDSLNNISSSYWSSFRITGFGISSEKRITESQNIAYINALNKLLLPRLLVQLQNTLDKSSNPNQIFNLLKFYGMLGGLGPKNQEFLVLQAQDMFAALYPEESKQNIRNALMQHVKALVANSLAPISLDKIRIENARKKIQAVSVETRAYNILLDRSDARDLTIWAPSQALGPVGQRAFERKSGRSLETGIAGIYTQTGYKHVILAHLNEAIQDAINENWVRGGQQANHQPNLNALSSAVMQNYFDDFRSKWAETLADIKI